MYTPREVQPGQVISFRVGGFGPHRQVTILLEYARQELGEATADAAGVVEGIIDMPEAAAGVDMLLFSGTTETGIGVARGLAVRYPGQPVAGESYATYLCCFEPTPDPIPTDWVEDYIDIFYYGEPITYLLPDEDGGVLIQLPVFVPGEVTIEAVSRRTGKALTEVINPIPSP